VNNSGCAQLKFLEERKKAKAMASGDSLTAPGPAEATSSDSRTAQNAWKFIVGNGTLGVYTVLRHIQYGTIVEMWHGAC
jgi:hypothetical protein